MDRSKSVDQDDLDRWADLSGDHNPLHTDPVYAAGTRYGGTILHGHLTVAWLMERAVQEWGTTWLTEGRLAELRFRQPLHPDTTYRVTATPSPTGSGLDLAVLLSDGTAAVTAHADLTSTEGEPS